MIRWVFGFAAIVAWSMAGQRAFGLHTIGLDSYAANATVIVIAHVPSGAESARLPAALRNRLIVDQTIKGFDTRHYLGFPSGQDPRLSAGRSVIVLMPSVMQRYDLVDRPPRFFENTALMFLPIDGNQVDSGGIPLNSQGGEVFGLKRETMLDKAAVMKVLTDAASEEAGLQTQILDCLFFPDRFKALERSDPERARYVRLVGITRDVARDVPTLANLLEWPDASLRTAVARHLQAITGAGIAPPTSQDPSALAANAQAWRDWWSAHAASLVWDEAKFAYVQLGADAAPFSEPPIPADLNLPDQPPPAALLSALSADHGRADINGMGPAFRALLDDGETRDRYIRAISRQIWLPRGMRHDPPAWLAKAGVTLGWQSNLICPSELGYLINNSGMVNCAFGGSSGEAARLRPALLDSADVPAADRAALMTMYALVLLNDNRFIPQRQANVAYLRRPHPDAELVRRAAVWGAANPGEPDDLGNMAQVLLSASETPADQELLARLFIARPIHCSFEAMRHSIEARHERFIQLLLADLRTGSGPSFYWPGMAMAQAHEPRAADALSARLTDKDSSVRRDAAFDLCWIPSRDVTPALLSALHKETDAKARGNILLALSQIGDPRALDDLLAAIQQPNSHNVSIELARGLGRIGDKRALPALADIALNSTDDAMHNEAICNFGYISGLFKTHPPSRFETFDGVSLQQMQAGMAIIQQWRKDHANAVH